MQVLVQGQARSYRTVTYDAGSNQVQLIEQRLLPHEFRIHSCPDYELTAGAIREMIVRGAGAIGATAAFGLAQGLRAFSGKSSAEFIRHTRTVYETLESARPTAVDPVNAMRRILAAIESVESVADKQRVAAIEAAMFADDNVADCRSIGEHGCGLISDGMRILTHCNAGWLAFVDYGSATAPMYAARDAGVAFHVYCDETRPRCQGATLTAWELAQENISHHVIADNAAGHLMQRGKIDLVLVGSDRVLGRTGAVANKIGTYTKAVLARHHNIPFYVAIPQSTIDWTLTDFGQIPIEERDESEVLGAWGIDEQGLRRYVRIANPGSSAVNPGFDVTPPEWVTGIITPQGIFNPGDLWENRHRFGVS